MKVIVKSAFLFETEHELLDIGELSREEVEENLRSNMQVLATEIETVLRETMDEAREVAPEIMGEGKVTTSGSSTFEWLD
jgi:actin-like ATPase involved in cell morphogenesis